MATRAAAPEDRCRGLRDQWSLLRRLPRLALGRRRMVVGIAVVLLLAVVVVSEPGHAALLRLLAAGERAIVQHPAWAAVLVVLLTALAAMLAFVSSWLVVPVAIYTWGPFRTLLLLLGGWVLGGVVSYAIGRALGRPVIRWLGLSTFLHRYEERVSRQTPFAVALLVQLALPSEVRGYLFGVGRYRFLPYVLSLFLAELPFAVGVVYGGAGVVAGSVVPLIAMGAALVALTAWALVALRHRLGGERHRHPAAASVD